MTVRTLILGAVLTAALAGMAAATVVNESGPPVGAKSGGAASLTPGGAVRLQCWQNGVRIIDEASLRDAAVNFFDSSNSLRFRRNGGADQMVMLVNPSPETTCLLQEERKGGE
ncbi:MAG TPA: hypothetical protein VEX87_03290, partial [Skermanella sp.]|nr:hypothetical protein [Skermanella sp.]